MDAKQIRRLRPMLERFLGNFTDCFGRSDTRAHLPVYVRGQLGDLPRKSVEPIALQAGIPPRTLQQFLSFLEWDEKRLVRHVHELVAREHPSSHAVGIIDETGCPKKGTKTPGVQRQYCGATGKIENCVVTVHLGYAVDDFHCLLTSALYLPESWARDRTRCREAGIPDDVDYRPKWRIALELYDEAVAHGLRFAWLTFDEHYGSKPKFLRQLDRRQQRYVAEVPVNGMGWLKPPRLRPGRRRLHVRRPATRIDVLARYSPAFTQQPWQRFRVKDGEKGPMVWEAKQVRFYPQTEDGDPAMPVHLVIARNALAPEEVKYFLSNAPAQTRLEVLLLVAFSRWHVERCFEDEKTELGFDHYEGRNYRGLLRHQSLTSVTHLFLARVRLQSRGEKSGAYRLPSSHRHRGVSALVVAGRESGDASVGANRWNHPLPTTAERQGPQEPHETHPPPSPRLRHPRFHPTAMPVGQ